MEKLKLQTTIFEATLLKVIIHKLRLAILMEQNLRFVLVLCQLAVLKNKISVDYEQRLWAGFSCFHGQKINL